MVAQEPITSAGRVGGVALSMPDARHPDIGALLPALVRDAGLDIVDAWAEAPAGVGPGPGHRRTWARSPMSTPATIPSCCLRSSPCSAASRSISAVADEPEPWDRVPPPGPRRRRRRGGGGLVGGAAAPRRGCRRWAAPRPTRSSPTTSPTSPPECGQPRQPSPTAPRAPTRPTSPAPSWPTPSPIWRLASWGARTPSGPRRTGSMPARHFVTVLPRPRLPGRAAPGVEGDRHLDRRLRAGARDVPPLRPGTDPSPRRAHPPRQRRHPRGDHHRPGRDGRAGAVDPRGVRRFRHRGRQRLHGHGGGDRGAVVGLARRRRLADHPPGDPEPCPGGGRHRRAEADRGCPGWRRGRS